MRAAIVGVFFTLGVLAAGCQRQSDSAVALDLVRALAATASAGPTARIDPAEPAAWVHFVSGWTVPERAEDGGTVVWVSRSRGRVWFDAGPRPVDRIMVIECESRADPAYPLRVLVRVNWRGAGRLRVARGIRKLRVVLPATLQVPGRNVVDFVVAGRGRYRGAGWYGQGRRTRWRGRRRRARWRGRRRRAGPRGRGRRFGLRLLRIEPSSSSPPAPRARGDRLILPPGTEVTYFLRLPPAARMAFDGLEGSPGGLQVLVEPDGGSEHVVASGLSGTGRVEIALGPAGDGRPVRLVLRASAGGVTLLRPRILGRARQRRRAQAAHRPGARLNVLLYVADTLRADHLGCYGYERPTSPHIDAFARSAVLFERAVAQSSWTRPAVAALLTGRHPQEHGARRLMDALRPDVPTMAEMLRAAGYATAAFVTNLNVAAKFGFARGFDNFHYLPERKDRPGVYASAAELNAAAFGWLAEHRAGPFFLYLHASDPHAPYRPQGPGARRFVPPGIHPTIDEATPLRRLLAEPRLATPDNVALLAGLYDADVAALDEGFGAVLAEVRKLGIAGSTLVVFVADHGEEFHEHGGFEHGRTLYEEVVRVPLIVRIPGRTRAGRRVSRLVRQIDVLPTVLGALGLEVPEDLPGRPLLSEDGAADASAPAAALMETRLHPRALAGIVLGRWKAVWREDRPGAVKLFDLARDPGERRDLSAERPIVAGYAKQTALRVQLAIAARAPRPPGATRVVDPQTEQRLRALGYVGQR